MDVLTRASGFAPLVRKLRELLTVLIAIDFILAKIAVPVKIASQPGRNALVLNVYTCVFHVSTTGKEKRQVSLSTVNSTWRVEFMCEKTTFKSSRITRTTETRYEKTATQPRSRHLRCNTYDGALVLANATTYINQTRCGRFPRLPEKTLGLWDLTRTLFSVRFGGTAVR